MADTRAKLRAYFAERKDASHGVDNVAAWIEALGTALGKQDIVDGAGALAVYMVTTKGFTALASQKSISKPQGGSRRGTTQGPREDTQVPKP